MTLQSYRDYIRQMVGSMTVCDAKKHQGFIEALYATEAFLVEKAKIQLQYTENQKVNEESPALTGLPKLISV